MVAVSTKGTGEGVNFIAIGNKIFNQSGGVMHNLYALDKSSVGSRLNNWADWKMASGMSLGYPSMSSFTKMRVDGQRIEDFCAGIDSECIETDKAVQDLPYLHNIIIRVEYLSVYKESSIKAYKCGISKRAYYNYLDHAKELVANNLNLLHNVHDCDINVLCG